MPDTYSIGFDARFCTAQATGIGRYVRELVDWLATQKIPHHFTLYTTAEGAKQWKNLPRNFQCQVVEYPIYSWQEQILFGQKLNRARHDLMVFPHFNVPLIFRGKMVITIHDLILHSFAGKKHQSPWQRLAYKLVLSRAVRRAEHIFTVSEFTSQLVQKHFSRLPEVSAIPNGVSTTFFPRKIPAQLKKKYQLPERYFLYTGVCREHKNLPRLITAFEKFKITDAKNCFLLLAGPDQEMIAEHIRGASHIRHLGLLPEADLPLIMAGAWGYVFPSLAEGFGLPVLEAMRSGVPVACSSSSSLPEVGGSAALYFAPESIREITQALKTLNQNQQKRVQLIAAGKKQAAGFSWEFSAEKWWQQCEKVLKER